MQAVWMIFCQWQWKNTIQSRISHIGCLCKVNLICVFAFGRCVLAQYKFSDVEMWARNTRESIVWIDNSTFCDQTVLSYEVVNQGRFVIGGRSKYRKNSEPNFIFSSLIGEGNFFYTIDDKELHCNYSLFDIHPCSFIYPKKYTKQLFQSNYLQAFQLLFHISFLQSLLIIKDTQITVRLHRG